MGPDKQLRALIQKHFNKDSLSLGMELTVTHQWKQIIDGNMYVIFNTVHAGQISFRDSGRNHC